MKSNCIAVSKAACLLTVLASSAQPQLAFAENSFWDSATTHVAYAQAAQGSAQYSAFSDSQTARYDRAFASAYESVQRSGFAMQYALNGDTTYAVSHASATDQRNTIVGFTHKNLSLSYMSGSGDDYAELAGDYSGIDPYTFRQGFNQRFNYSGYAADYAVGRLGHLQYGEATLQSNGLLDRRTQYAQWAGQKAFVRVSQFSRGAQSIGNGFDFGVNVGRNKQLGFQALQFDNDRSLQRIRFKFEGRKARQYWVDLSAHSNALYRDNDDMSIMFTFKAPLGATVLARYSDDDSAADEVVTDQPAAGAQAPVKKKRSMAKTMLWVGAGAVAAASLGSSGSSSTDTVMRFRTKQDAAFDVLNRVNPISVDENREYGGWVYQASDGSFGSSEPAVGTQSMVTLPNARASTPAGSNLAATYHTHAAFHRRFDNENFSEQDLESDRALGIDGYLATPGGLFKWHNVTTGEIITIGPIAN